MAKWIVGKGIDNYIAYLQSLELATDEIIGKAVYEMAKVLANNIKSNMLALPAVSNEANIATYKKGYSRLSEPEKEGLIEGFGISPMRNDQGYVNVKLGFDGYNSVKTKKYPNGQPNALIARVTESGSPYREKTGFIRKSVNASKKDAEDAGRATIDKEIYAISQD